MSTTALQAKSITERMKRGLKPRRDYRSAGYSAIDGRRKNGRDAKHWRAEAIKQKGGAACPFHVKAQIEAAAFDLWLMLELAEEIAQDAKRRGSVLNRRYKTLPKIHDQFDKVSARFERRRESLQLDKGGLDLARRLMVERGK